MLTPGTSQTSVERAMTVPPPGTSQLTAAVFQASYDRTGAQTDALPFPPIARSNGEGVTGTPTGSVHVPTTGQVAELRHTVSVMRQFVRAVPPVLVTVEIGRASCREGV